MFIAMWWVSVMLINGIISLVEWLVNRYANVKADKNEDDYDEVSIE